MPNADCQWALGVRSQLIGTGTIGNRRSKIENKFMEHVIKDIRYCLRSLLKRPGFTAVVVLTLALGIGANTAFFGIVNAVLLRSLPYEDANRLVVLWEKVSGDKRNPTSYPNFLDWRAQNRSFETMAAYSLVDFNLGGQTQTDRIEGELVSESYFPLLRVGAAHGRIFTAEENQTGNAQSVAVISDAAWQRLFGADPTVLNRTIKLNEAQLTIIGIMPKGFRGFSGSSDVWAPIAARDLLWPQTARFSFLTRRDIHWHRVIGRLKPGVTLAGAQADMEAIGARLADDYPQANDKRGVGLALAQDYLVGNLRAPLLVLLGTVGFVLLIACANVANLLLVRAAARSKEVSIRLAMGAGRWRLIQQLLTESLLLALLGGGAGLLFALWGIDLFISVLPVKLPGFAAPSIDFRVLGFATFVATMTGLLIGLIPALHASRVNLNDWLKDGTKGSGSRRTHRTRSLLVVTEIALALVLMIGAGLMLKSFQRMQQVDPGFKPDNLLTLRIDVPNQKYREQQRTRLGQQLIDKAQALPGVEAAAITFTDPFVFTGINLAYGIEGRPPLTPAERESAFLHLISPNYFQTMGIPLVAGRDFAVTDNLDAPGVVIVSDSFARRYWPNESAIGKRIKFAPDDPKTPWLSIVGVAGNVKFRSLRQDLSAETIIYQPNLQSKVVVSLSLLVRTTKDPQAMLTALSGMIRNFDPDIPVYSMATMNDRLADQATDVRSLAWLIGAFAFLAVLLASIGIYAVMSYVVSQRTQEVGIRIALGAQRADVLKLIIGHSLKVTVAGVVIGLIGALVVTRFLEGLLFDVKPFDPKVFALISALITAVGLLACYVPARRATKVDPLVALRDE
jgi:predicted permease